MTEVKNSFIGRKFCMELNDLNETEKDFLISLEFDNEVASYFPAKMEIQLSDDPEQRLKLNYCVVYKNTFESIFHIYKDGFNYTVWNKVLDSLADLKVNFQPISKETIEFEPRKSNLRILWKYAYAKEPKVICLNDLHDFFVVNRLPQINKLKEFFLKKGYSAELVYNLIFHRTLICDVDNHNLNDETVILLNPYFELCNKWKPKTQNNSSLNKKKKKMNLIKQKRRRQENKHGGLY